MLAKIELFYLLFYTLFLCEFLHNFLLLHITVTYTYNDISEWQDGVHQSEGVVSHARGLSELGEHRAALLPVSLISEVECWADTHVTV